MRDVSCNKNHNMNILNFINKKMSSKAQKASEVINNIEIEMKKIGFWSENPPDFNASNFTEAPTFELWLQCVFIPNAREAVKTGEYPEKSQVGLMALRQYNYHSYTEEAQELLSMLNDFDRIIESQ